MHATIGGLVSTYGYAFLFLLVGIESFGVPLPGETALVSAAAYAALGHLNIVLVIAAAAAGAIVGDNGGYWIGRRGGIALVRRYGRHVGLDEAKLARAHAFFERHGAKTVFIGRFIALLRSWAAALAGVGGMPYARFMLYNALGGIAWATLFGVLGYAFGRNLPRLEHYVGQVSLVLVLLATLAVLAWLGLRWFRPRRERLAAGVTERWRRLAGSPRVAALRARHPRLWHFVIARLAPGEYLGLHLTISLVLSLAALWLFGGITEDVVHHDPLTAVDLRLAAWFRVHATPLGDRVGVFFSTIGSPAGMGVLFVVVALVLVYRRWWITLSGWVAAFAGAGVLTEVIKRVIHRPRPAGAARFLHGASFSFPSGHALGSLVGVGMLAFLLIEFWGPGRRHRTAVASLATLLILAIGLSRLYLVVHYLSDVIGGYACGLVWLIGCITGLDLALRQRGLIASHGLKGPPDAGGLSSAAVLVIAVAAGALVARPLPAQDAARRGSERSPTSVQTPCADRLSKGTTHAIAFPTAPERLHVPSIPPVLASRRARGARPCPDRLRHGLRPAQRARADVRRSRLVVGRPGALLRDPRADLSGRVAARRERRA